MLNPDGVVNGNYRANLAGKDLNRVWAVPAQDRHPTIWHLKRFLNALKHDGNEIYLYCDFHGHSKQEGTFLYGCPDRTRSMINSEADWICSVRERIFSFFMAEESKSFRLNNCTYKVSTDKRTTARVVVYEELGVGMSYTLESSFLGSRGTYFTPRVLEEIGEAFCRSIYRHEDNGEQLLDSIVAEGSLAAYMEKVKSPLVSPERDDKDVSSVRPPSETSVRLSLEEQTGEDGDDERLDHGHADAASSCDVDEMRSVSRGSRGSRHSRVSIFDDTTDTIWSTFMGMVDRNGEEQESAAEDSGSDSDPSGDEDESAVVYEVLSSLFANKEKKEEKAPTHTAYPVHKVALGGLQLDVMPQDTGPHSMSTSSGFGLPGGRVTSILNSIRKDFHRRTVESSEALQAYDPLILSSFQKEYEAVMAIPLVGNPREQSMSGRTSAYRRLLQKYPDLCRKYAKVEAPLKATTTHRRSSHVQKSPDLRPRIDGVYMSERPSTRGGRSHVGGQWGVPQGDVQSPFGSAFDRPTTRGGRVSFGGQAAGSATVVAETLPQLDLNAMLERNVALERHLGAPPEYPDSTYGMKGAATARNPSGTRRMSTRLIRGARPTAAHTEMESDEVWHQHKVQPKVAIRRRNSSEAIEHSANTRASASRGSQRPTRSIRPVASLDTPGLHVDPFASNTRPMTRERPVSRSLAGMQGFHSVAPRQRVSIHGHRGPDTYGTLFTLPAAPGSKTARY